MLSFEKTPGSIPIASVTKSYDNDGEILYINPDDDSGHKTASLEDGNFIPIPNPKFDSNVYYLNGPRGSGKTYLSVSIAEMYNELHPDRNIYIFSQTATTDQNTKLYGRLKNLQVMVLDDTLITNPLKLEELRDSLCIFDDYNTLGEVSIQEGKKTKTYNLSKAVQKIIDDVIQNGRHYNISSIICSHMMFAYAKSRQILEELNYLVFYRDTGSRHKRKYLQDFMGLEKQDVTNILARKSRWTLVSKMSPRFVLTEYEAMII